MISLHVIKIIYRLKKKYEPLTIREHTFETNVVFNIIYCVEFQVQILIKGKKLSKDYLMQQFLSYLKSGAFGLTVGTSFVPLNCLLRYNTENQII